VLRIPVQENDPQPDELIGLAQRLFPICRSITGNGFRQSISILEEHLPGLRIHEVASGTKVFDWTVPDEWNVRDAYVLDPLGRKVIDFKQHNLHLVGYSEPISQQLSLQELQQHLHSLPDKPDAIPYVTSYYKRTWGFCLPQHQRDALVDGTYTVYIDADLAPGSLTYADLVIPGKVKDEVFFSTYLCHPSMANNELSGPIVTTFLAKWLSNLPQRHFTYRIAIVPETIGALVYLSQNLRTLQKRVKAGYVITCVGDPGKFSLIPSRTGSTLADRVSRHVLDQFAPDYTKYSFLQRGSDERQYCSPLVDLPMNSITRSKYHEYVEYHTSLDNLDFITDASMRESIAMYQQCVLALEGNCITRASTIGEPQLGKRGLYPTTGGQVQLSDFSDIFDLLALSDGQSDLLDIATRMGRPISELVRIAELLRQHQLLTIKTIK
jgi:aminopeptidase-like protein